MDDFRLFLDAAHERGMRVITELVVNHTSDQHAWFQEARSSRDHPRRDWYVWSDTDDRYPGVRIIFTDTERSNWAWDPATKQYYWHRFFSHQPDLNYDNPAVREEIWKVMQFWLDIGVDGFRVDAVPYLIEREGTSCENLPETHDILKFLRRRLDEHYTGKVLLAEANQWPEDVRHYFGDNDEFHMAVHSPIMPRMFMALRLEDRKPLVEIIERTPAIPETCRGSSCATTTMTLRWSPRSSAEIVRGVRAIRGQRRHPPPSGAPCSGATAAASSDERPADVAPGSPLSTTATKSDGRQHSWRPQRRPHADVWNGGWNAGLIADPERLASIDLQRRLHGYQPSTSSRRSASSTAAQLEPPADPPASRRRCSAAAPSAS